MKCALEGCNKKARRKFCCNKHKDRYHNIHNPRGHFAYLNPDKPEYDLQRIVEDSEHPYSPDALGQD
jgi:hypothetical protein